ncbi:MAG: carbohydrate ABC transporter permease [Christensenellaceae bacterium]
MFTFPLALGLGIFTLYPMIQSLIWSFFEYTGVYYYPTGLKNYISIFSGTTFWRVFGNTCFYTFVNVPIILVVSYLLASLVNLPLKAVGGFRVAYYLPCVIPGVVSGLLWQDIFRPTGFSIRSSPFSGRTAISFPVPKRRRQSVRYFS